MDWSDSRIWTDGVVTLKPPGPGDGQSLIEGRDGQFFRWIGPGAQTPNPVACVWARDELIGWVDYDVDHDWLKTGQVNVGYYLFAPARGHGFASRAVVLLLEHLRRDTAYTTATLMIHPDNSRSLALAARLGFVEQDKIDGSLFFSRET